MGRDRRIAEGDRITRSVLTVDPQSGRQGCDHRRAGTRHAGRIRCTPTRPCRLSTALTVAELRRAGNAGLVTLSRPAFPEPGARHCGVVRTALAWSSSDEGERRDALASGSGSARSRESVSSAGSRHPAAGAGGSTTGTTTVACHKRTYCGQPPAGLQIGRPVASSSAVP